MSEGPAAIHAPPSGTPTPRQQHGDEEHAAAATLSAVNQAEPNEVAEKLAVTHLAGTIAKTTAINAGSLKAAINTNKPKITSPLRTCATPGGSVTHAPADMDKIWNLVGMVKT